MLSGICDCPPRGARELAHLCSMSVLIVEDGVKLAPEADCGPEGIALNVAGKRE